MKAKPRGPEQDDLFRARLVEIIDTRHELVKLAALIDREFLDREWAGFFPFEAGRPATPSRLVAGPSLPAACLQAVRRGCGRALGGDPLLPAFPRCDRSSGK